MEIKTFIAVVIVAAFSLWVWFTLSTEDAENANIFFMVCAGLILLGLAKMLVGCNFSNLLSLADPEAKFCPGNFVGDGVILYAIIAYIKRIFGKGDE